MASEARRLHPSSLLFGLFRQAKALLIPGLIVLLAARGETWQLWVMALFVPSAIYEVVRFFTLRYRLTESELVVTSAFIGRSERHIPLARINNIDLSQSPIHRLLGVAEVKVQTGSGAEPEAVLRVLSLDAVEQLRQGVFGAARPVEQDAAAPETLLTLGPAELVRLGLVSNRAMAALAAVAALAWEFDLIGSETVEQYIEPLFDSLPGPGAVAMTVVAAAALLIVLSIAWSFLRFWGFRLQRCGEDLRITAGLLTRTSATIPRRRIQLVVVYESIIRRILRRASVRIKTAGGAHDEGDRAGAAWFAPLIERDRLDDLLHKVRPLLTADSVAWTPLSGRARRRMIIAGVLLGLVLWAIVGVALRSWPALAGALLVPLCALIAWRAWRNSRWSDGAASVRMRSGGITRRTVTTFDDKMQVISVRQSPLDRWWKMASVRIDTAGAGFAG
ncbi:MAG: PH domain-containing protein, partial [Phycisphaerales bacterium JB039]